MASVEQVLPPGAVTQSRLTPWLQKKQAGTAFHWDRKIFPLTVLSLLSSSCWNKSPVEPGSCWGRSHALIFLASGSNGYSKWAHWASEGWGLSHTIYSTQTVPSGTSGFPEPPIPQMRTTKLKVWVVSGDISLLLTHTHHPSSFVLLPLTWFLFVPCVPMSCNGLWLFQIFSEWVGPRSRVTYNNQESQTHLSSSICVRDVFFSLIFLFYWSNEKKQKNPRQLIHIFLRLRALGCKFLCGMSNSVLFFFLLNTVRFIQNSVLFSSLWDNSHLFSSLLRGKWAFPAFSGKFTDLHFELQNCGLLRKYIIYRKLLLQIKILSVSKSTVWSVMLLSSCYVVTFGSQVHRKQCRK